MAFVILGGVAGFLLGAVLSQLLFGPRVVARQHGPAARRGGKPGAGFLLMMIVTFGGMVAGAMAAG
jgi:hypothetical protein